MLRVEGHSVTKYDQFLFVFGGFDLDTSKESNALYRIDIAEIERGLNRHDGISEPSSGVAAVPAGKAPGTARGNEFMHFGAPVPPVANEPAAVAAAAPHWRPQAPASEDVFMYPVATTGPTPSPRAHHACCLRGPYMVVWGGSQSSTVEEGLLGSSTRPLGTGQTFQSGAASLDHTELFALNLESMVWTRYCVASIAPEVKQHNVPQQRCHASLVCSEDALLLYGGYPTTIQQGEETLAFAPNEWRVFRVCGDGTCEAQEPAGAAPTLWGNSCVYAHRCILAFGGIDALSNEEVNSLCVYHLDERRWRWAEFPEGPCARALHSAVFDSAQSAMIVYGGLSSSADDDSPEMSLHGSSRNGNPMVSQLQDVWSFSLETGLWERLFPSVVGAAARQSSADNSGGSRSTTGAPPGRSGHAAVYHNHRMFVVGGLVDQSDGPPAPSSSTSSAWFLQGSTSPSSPRGNPGGNLLIFDLRSRQWKTKNLIVAKVNAGPMPSKSQQPAVLQAGTNVAGESVEASMNQQSRRESIIDKYLNLASASTPPAPSPSRLSNTSHSGVRTVGSIRQESSLAMASPSSTASPLERRPPGTGSSLQHALVSTVMHETAEENKKRKVDQQRKSNSPPRAVAAMGDGDESTGVRSASRGTKNFADAIAAAGYPAPTSYHASPLSAQRDLTNKVLESFRTPPRSQETTNQSSEGMTWNSITRPAPSAAAPLSRVHNVVSAISQQQSAADLRWTAAENDRRSKLLMQYLTNHGDASAMPWATMTSQSGLQDDEIDSASRSVGGERSPSRMRIDPRLIVSSPAAEYANGRGGTSPSRERLLSSPRHVTETNNPFADLLLQQRSPTVPRQVDVGTSSSMLDEDEVLPFTSVRPHPLSPGPWYPLQ